MKHSHPLQWCDCGIQRPWAACCGRWSRASPPDTAEALMRSRYCAYVRRDHDWLIATWHPDRRPAALELEAPPRPKWLGLRVLRSVQQDETHALVEFEARYTLQGRAFRLHETSLFERVDGVWYYVAADTDPRTGANGDAPAQE